MFYNRVVLLFLLALLPNTSSAEPRKVFADYFSGMATPEQDGDHGVWGYDGGGPIHWSADRHVSAHRKRIVGNYYPLIGPYDSNDPDLVEYHILLAKSSGVDGFIAEWAFAGEHRNHRALQLLAAMSKRYGFEIGVNWVNSAMTTWQRWLIKTRKDIREHAVLNLRWLLDNLYADGGGARIGGRPLILLFEVSAWPLEGLQPYFDPGDMAALDLAGKQYPQEPLLVVGPRGHESLAESVDGAFSWASPSQSPASFPWGEISLLPDLLQYLSGFLTSSAFLLEQGVIATYVAGIARGFDDHRGLSWGGRTQRYIPHGDGKTIEAMFQAATESGAPAAFLVTWNDIEEATAFSPTVEAGYRDVDLVAKHAAKFKGTLVLPAELRRQPIRLYRLRKDIALLGVLGEQTLSLEKGADQIALAIAEARVEVAGDKLAALEQTVRRYFGRFAQRHFRRVQGGRDGLLLSGTEVQRAGRTGFTGDVAITWHERDVARIRGQGSAFAGRLSFDYFDGSLGAIEVRQGNGENAIVWASFRTEGTNRWRRAIVDLSTRVASARIDSNLQVVLKGEGETPAITNVEIEGDLWQRPEAEQPTRGVTALQEQLRVSVEGSVLAEGIASHDNTFVVVGNFSQRLEIGPYSATSAGDLDGFVALFGADGRPRRLLRIGGPYTERLLAVQATETGYRAQGRFFGEIKIGETPLVSRTIAATPGEPGAKPTAIETAFEIVLDRNGEIVSARTIDEAELPVTTLDARYGGFRAVASALKWQTLAAGVQGLEEYTSVGPSDAWIRLFDDGIQIASWISAEPAADRVSALSFDSEGRLLAVVTGESADQGFCVVRLGREIDEPTAMLRDVGTSDGKVSVNGCQIGSGRCTPMWLFMLLVFGLRRVLRRRTGV